MKDKKKPKCKRASMKRWLEILGRKIETASKDPQPEKR